MNKIAIRCADGTIVYMKGEKSAFAGISVKNILAGCALAVTAVTMALIVYAIR